MPPSTLLLTTAFWYTSFYLLCFSHCQFNWCNITFVTLVLIRMKDVCYCFLKYTIIYGKVWLILLNIVTLNHLFTVYICIIFVSICPCAEGLHCLNCILSTCCCSVTVDGHHLCQFSRCYARHEAYWCVDRLG